MAYQDDITVLNDVSNANSDFSIVSGFDGPQDNTTASTFPLYLEGTSAAEWPLKKGQTLGYAGTSQITGTPDMSGERTVIVGFINFPYADIDNIPITLIRLRMSSATGFTTNYAEWDALGQILSPNNVPISGHTPVLGHHDNADNTSGTPNYATIESVGWVATTGNNNDGKQGGFDWLFIISHVGTHSQTNTETFFNNLYDEYFDNEGQGLPGETSRPIAVLSKAGDVYQSNISFRLGDGTSDTANTVVTETGKTVFFNNLTSTHECGFEFINPSGANEIRVTFTDCTFLWNSADSNHEIFDGIANVDHFKIDGCAFSNGGQISLPSGSADRYVRNTKFTGCQTGTASDSEFTNCTLDNCGQMTITGDADFTGTKVLNSAAATGTGALVWNDNTDPNGNLDDMAFSKGTNAHHAIEFGTNTPTTITLTDITFSGFNASDGQNDSTLYFPDTGSNVTWTVNLSGTSGNVSYRKARAGDTVTIQNTVTLTVRGVTSDNEPTTYARVSMHRVSDGVEIFKTNASTVDELNSGYYKGTYSYNYSTDTQVRVRARYSSSGGTKYKPFETTQTITTNGLDVTAVWIEDTIAN